MSPRPSLTDTLRSLARSLEEETSAHPQPEVLLAYHREELPATDQEVVEEHLLWCRECRGIVKDLPSFLHGAVPEVEAEEKAADLEELMRWSGEAKPSDDMGKSAAGSYRRFPWLQAIAAILLLSVGASGLWIGQLKGRLQEALEPQPNVPIHDLNPPAADRATAGSPEVELAVGERAVLILNPRGDLRPGSYEARFLDPDGRLVWSSPELKPSRFGNFSLELVGGYLPSGRYRVELVGPRPDSDQRIGIFTLRLTERQDP